MYRPLVVSSLAFNFLLGGPFVRGATTCSTLRYIALRPSLLASC